MGWFDITFINQCNQNICYTCPVDIIVGLKASMLTGIKITSVIECQTKTNWKMQIFFSGKPEVALTQNRFHWLSFGLLVFIFLVSSHYVNVYCVIMNRYICTRFYFV